MPAVMLSSPSTAASMKFCIFEGLSLICLVPIRTIRKINAMMIHV